MIENSDINNESNKKKTETVIEFEDKINWDELISQTKKISSQYL